MIAVMPYYLPFFIVGNELSVAVKTVVRCCEIIIYQNFACNDFRSLECRAIILGNILLEDLLTKPIIPNVFFISVPDDQPIISCLHYNLISFSLYKLTHHTNFSATN